MPNRKPKVYFHYLEKVSLSKRNHLKAFIEQLFKKEKRALRGLQYIFCSDSYLLSINKQFLNHDFYTDIITFDLSEGEEISAEVYISLDRVKENASFLKLAFKQELHRVMFHGVLHLCGYKDKSAKDLKLIRQKEDYYLRKFNEFIMTR
jgi:probable rRNA maturation factor